MIFLLEHLQGHKVFKTKWAISVAYFYSSFPFSGFVACHWSCIFVSLFGTSSLQGENCAFQSPKLPNEIAAAPKLLNFGCVCPELGVPATTSCPFLLLIFGEHVTPSPTELPSSSWTLASSEDFYVETCAVRMCFGLVNFGTSSSNLDWMNCSVWLAIFVRRFNWCKI